MLDLHKVKDLSILEEMRYNKKGVVLKCWRSIKHIPAVEAIELDCTLF